MNDKIYMTNYIARDNSSYLLTSRELMMIDLSSVVSVNKQNKSAIIDELINAGWVKQQ
jgi:hypothetical protein